MTYWTLTESDIDRIAIGVGILGTGGGGSPYLQMLIAKQLLREGKRIRMIRPADLDPNAQIIGLGASARRPFPSRRWKKALKACAF